MSIVRAVRLIASFVNLPESDRAELEAILRELEQAARDAQSGGARPESSPTGFRLARASRSPTEGEVGSSPLAAGSSASTSTEL
jgi:hypothetical protein